MRLGIAILSIAMLFTLLFKVGMAQGFLSSTGGAGIGGTGGTVTNQAGLDTVINVKNFGADPTRTNDSTTAIQNAILAACGMATLSSAPGNLPHSAVLLPGGQYLTTISSTAGPIRIPCGNLQFYGLGPSSWIRPNYIGPGIIDAPYGANNLQLTTSLVTGTGNAMILNGCSGANCGTLPITAVIGAKATNSMNGLAAANVEFIFEPTATPPNGTIEYIFGFHPSTASASGTTGVFNVKSDAGGLGEIQGCFSIGGVSKCAPVSAALVNNSIYDVSLDYNGSTVALCVGTTGSATTCTTLGSLSGTLTQDAFEVAQLPDRTTNWFPDVQNAQSTSWPGIIDSIKVSNQSVHQSTYTAPTAKLSADAHTLMLENFVNTGYVSDQLQQVLVQNGTAQYLAVGGVSNGPSALTNAAQYVHDFQIERPIVARWVPSSTFERVIASVAGYPHYTAGINWADDDFLDTRNSNLSQGFPIGIEYGSNDNESGDVNNSVGQGTTYACFVSVSGGGQDEVHPVCADGGKLLYSWIYNATMAHISYPFTDFEQLNSTFLGTFFLIGNSSINIESPDIGTLNNASFFVVSGGGPIVVTNPRFIAATTNPIFHIASAPTAPARISGIQTNGNSIGALSDNLAWVVTPGCSGVTTLSGGSGTISNKCFNVSNTGCSGIDITTPANAVTVGTLSAGSVAVTGTGTDVVKVVCQ